MVDLPVDQARQLLEDAGLEVVETAEQVADATRVGLVLSQNPESGIRVDEGTEVTIVVGSQNTFAMPPLAGSTPEQARNTLQGLGFTGELREEVQDSTEVDEGQIISTLPAAGEQVATTATITLIVSGGPPQTEIPPCEGISSGECANPSTAAGSHRRSCRSRRTASRRGRSSGPSRRADLEATARPSVVESARPAVVEVPAVEDRRGRRDTPAGGRRLPGVGRAPGRAEPRRREVLEQNPGPNATATFARR